MVENIGLEPITFCLLFDLQSFRLL